VNGKMFVQIIFHRPTTAKYGCYKPGGARRTEPQALNR
jgi:hypothetical protein